MTIEVPEEDEAMLADYANPFAFDATIYRGQELMTVGFGTANNPNRILLPTMTVIVKYSQAQMNFVSCLIQMI